MNSKERFQAVLNRQRPDRPPFNFWMDRPLMAQYEERIGHRHWRVTGYGADVIETFPGIAFPVGTTSEAAGSTWTENPLFDDWKDAPAVVLPDPHADDACALIKQDLAEFPESAVVLDMPTPWGVICAMRTYENVYMDMYDQPEAFRALCRRILGVQKVVVEKACKLGITALYLMEDLATTNGLAMSPDMIWEYCLDDARELADIARAHDIPIMFHSDGAVMELMPHLIKLGVSAVNPLQPHLNDLAEFHRQFGDKLSVYGGLDNCYTIPDKTAADVRAHVLDVFETLGKPHGGLAFSTHDIPMNTPPENVEEMVRTIKEECFYDA